MYFLFYFIKQIINKVFRIRGGNLLKNTSTLWTVSFLDNLVSKIELLSHFCFLCHASGCEGKFHNHVHFYGHIIGMIMYCEGKVSILSCAKNSHIIIISDFSQNPQLYAINQTPQNHGQSDPMRLYHTHNPNG